MPKIPENGSDALVRLEAIARELLGFDERTVERRAGRVALALAAALSGGREDVVTALDLTASKHLEPGIDVGEIPVRFGERVVRHLVSVPTASNEVFDNGLVRVLRRYQSRPWNEDRAESLAGEFATLVAERWPSLAFETTFERAFRHLKATGIKGDPEKVVRICLRKMRVTWKLWKNPFNAAAVASIRKNKSAPRARRRARPSPTTR